MVLFLLRNILYDIKLILINISKITASECKKRYQISNNIIFIENLWLNLGCVFETP